MVNKNMIEIRYWDGMTETITNPETVYDILHHKLGNKIDTVLVAKVNDVLKDLSYIVSENSKIAPVYFSDYEGKQVFWHSSAHILAKAVTAFIKDAKPTIGPPVEDGFYYDFDMNNLTKEDREEIEKRVKKIIQSKEAFERKEITKEEAYKLFENNRYKIEILNGIQDKVVSIYKLGDFIDLCHGPHIPYANYVKSFKITTIAAAHFKGLKENPQMQRIYGISFPTEKEMNDYIRLQEEIKKYDHRELGKNLDLFSFHDEGPGFVFMHNNGNVIKNELMKYWREIHQKEKYQEISTPAILSKELWLKSGHWEHYKDNMYFTSVDEKDFAIKPMNCPGAILVYKNGFHSYKEFPLRLGEIGVVRRNELGGVLHGLFRLREFTQDDAHIFISEDLIEEEITRIINIVDTVYKQFGLEYHVELSTRPSNSMGTDEQWNNAESALNIILEKRGEAYHINPGDGAFYGPKIDFHITDVFGRRWQCATIQLDFQLPIRFDVKYEGKDGKMHTPVVIHRVVYGAIERFIGILLEHFKGWLPLWLSPVHMAILPVGEKHISYAENIYKTCSDNNIRTRLLVDDTLQKRIRFSELNKIPFIVIVGDREITENRVMLRIHGIKEQKSMEMEDLIKRIKNGINSRTLQLENIIS
jgi:threonyl-tRNA synthetase